MAKLLGKLQALAGKCETKPKIKITQQTSFESVLIIRGMDEGIPVWHYILIPIKKIVELKTCSPGTVIDVTDYGRLIKYRDDQNKDQVMIGWGTNPPKHLKAWINECYEQISIDENIQLTYINDDIRLCSMQRIIPEQKLGIWLRYHQQDHFHYIKLTDDTESSLAYRGGIKNFDRIIAFNGINIENDTVEQFDERFENDRHLPIQMLVCSPATYEHYKSNKMPIHSNLSTVQRLKPVYDISLSDNSTSTESNSVMETIFCTIQWEDTNTMSIVPQSAIFKSPKYTHVNDICLVQVGEEYQKGKILCIGSHDDHQKLKRKLDSDITVSNVIIPNTHNNDKIQNNNILDIITVFEDFPNELFFELFDYIDVENLYRTFWGINSRLNNVLQLYPNLSLIFNENNDSSLISFYAFQVTKLAIDTSNNCNLNQFPKLHSLTIYNRNPIHIIQIQPDILPHLVYLSFSLNSTFKPPEKLVCDVFSNKFPCLCHVDLGCIDKSTSYIWSTSPRIQFLSIRCEELMIIKDILISCPNLDHLQMHVLIGYNNNIISCLQFTHPLQYFTLWGYCIDLSLDTIDTLLTYIPNVQYLYLQTTCYNPFVHLVNNIINRLSHLSRFDCFIKEMIINNDRIGNIDIIHKIHSCFNRIQCINETDKFRIFATE